MVAICTIVTCPSQSVKDPDRKFYRFPRDTKRCRLWVKAAGRPDLLEKTGIFLNRNYFMCDLHFHPSERLRRRLSRIAVPSLMLAPFKNENPIKSTQTDLTIDVKEEEFWNTRKRELCASEDIKEENKKRKTSDSSLTLASGNPGTSKKVASALVQLLKLIYFQKQLRIRYKTEKEMIDLFALKVCMTIPQTYRILQDLLELPTERKLCRDYIEIDTKLDSNALTCLEMKTNKMKISEKYCVVCAEKIDLQCNLYYQINKDKIIGFHDINGTQTPEPATHAIVIAARGIFSDWEQPLTYCFLSQGKHDKELNVLLYNTLSKVMSIGLKVTAFISGQEKIFTDVAKMWDVTVGNPHFLVNGKKIYYLFDFCNLVTTLRNKMMEYNFQFHDAEGNELIAKWEDVMTLYKIDSRKQYRLAPELTEAHVNPTREQKLKAEYSMRVFSKTIVAAMSFSKELGQLDETSEGTIKLIGLVSEIIEILNSSLDLSTSAALSNHIEGLNRFLIFLKDVKIQEKNTYNDVTKSMKYFKSLKVTLKNIIDLSQDLKQKGFQVFPTAKLFSSALQKFISLLTDGRCKSPTPIKLSRAFTKYFIDNILKHSDKPNSSDGLNRLLSMDLHSGLESFQPKVVRSLSIGTVDYRFTVPEEQSFIYVCGYLMKKCYDIHKCLMLDKYLHKAQDSDLRAQCHPVFINLKPVIIPTEAFIKFVNKMDSVFIRYFQNKIIHSVGNNIMNGMANITLDLCCPGLPVDYIKKLYIRFRIFNVICTNNKNFRDKMFKWKCFCIYNM